MSAKKWDAVAIAPDMIRLDTYEESLGDEWRGSVLLDASQARRLAVDLSRAAAEGDAMEKERKR